MASAGLWQTLSIVLDHCTRWKSSSLPDVLAPFHGMGVASHAVATIDGAQRAHGRVSRSCCCKSRADNGCTPLPAPAGNRCCTSVARVLGSLFDSRINTVRQAMAIRDGRSQETTNFGAPSCKWPRTHPRQPAWSRSKQHHRTLWLVAVGMAYTAIGKVRRLRAGLISGMAEHFDLVVYDGPRFAKFL